MGERPLSRPVSRIPYPVYRMAALDNVQRITDNGIRITDSQPYFPVYSSKLRPVISSGWGWPISARMVGATSASLPRGVRLI